MKPTGYLDAVQREAAAFAAAARAGVGARVPTCPDWSVGELTVHLGTIHRWVAETVRTCATERVKGRDERWAIDASRPDLVEWYEESARELQGVLAAADPSAPVWTFAPDGTVRFWYRRQAVETAIHRWDAENAHGSAGQIDGDLAAAGVEEYLAGFGATLRSMSTAEGRGESFHFHATDTPCEWLVTFEGDGMHVEPGHAKGDVAVRGKASLLLLFLWHRIGSDRLEVFGDDELLGRWFDFVPSP